MTHSTPSHSIPAAALGGALARLRERAPLVQCLTNIVVANFTANALLAAGCSPAMVDNPAEAAGFAAVSGGVLVNLGTPYAETAQAMAAAIDGAVRAGVPWVLDPIGAGALPWRTGLAIGWLARRPAIIRGNASEIIGLAGGEGGRGTDSTASPADALDAATGLARRHAAVVAVSGEVDLITDGQRLVRMANGDALLTRVTGAGCALGALMAGFAAVEEDRLVAAGAATALLTVAADQAVREARGPGSFAVRLLDALHALTPDELSAAVRLV